MTEPPLKRDKQKKLIPLGTRVEFAHGHELAGLPGVIVGHAIRNRHELGNIVLLGGRDKITIYDRRKLRVIQGGDP